MTITEPRPTYNALSAECPTRAVVATLSDKWVTLVICALADGSQRYGELASRVEGVSQKMLTQTLRNLERDGVVGRTVTPTVPVRVDYELTALGQELMPIILSIKAFAEANIERIWDARQNYDDALAPTVGEQETRK
jgi:DNA-binding HxlR family transcriptional regulator